MPNANDEDPLEVEPIRAAVLQRAAELRCGHAEVRVERIHSQYLSLRDGQVQSNADRSTVGVGVRVVHDGAVGFAASVELTPEACARLVEVAQEAAKVTSVASRRRVSLAPEPSHGRSSWVAPYGTDPTSVPLAERIELLSGWSRRLLAHQAVDHVSATLAATSEEKYYADLAGTVTDQRRVRIHPVVEVLGLAPGDGGFETMRTVAPPAGRGYEYALGEGWDFEHEVDTLPDLLAEKLAAPSVAPGVYDLVIDPTNLWLTIHESVGHATELDRALGYEAAYAGTSFVTFDKMGTLRYGSQLMNVTGDRTAPYGLATIAYDDEGVEAQSFDIVRDGVFVGYQLDRTIASEAALGRSNGCAYACSPLMTPIQRMANVSLLPAPGDGPTLEDLIGGVEHGIYIVGDKSWSIDMQRYNFQFTGQRFYRIEHGRLANQLRDVAYQATTTDFWGSMTGLGGRSTYLLGGATNCGKGQPGQTAPVSHGCPAAHFSGVRVLNARAEAGR